MSDELHSEGRSLPASAPATKKVAFRLTRDEDDYPPADWEHLWAREVGNSLFELDNTPFFAHGVSYRDIVSANEQDGMNVYRELIRSSGHRTLRVIAFDQDSVPQLRQSLRDLGCATELSHIPGLVAIDVPPSVDLSSVRGMLDEGEAAGRWEYEESAIR